jgi:integrase
MATAKRDGLYRRKGSGFWWVRTDPLDGVPRSTGCRDLEAARLWRAARERLAADPAAIAAKTATLGHWVSRTIAMIARTRSAATVSVYETKLGHFRRIWGDDCALATITPDKLDAYVQERRGETSDETISREVRHLLYLLRLAKRSRSYAGDLSTLRPPDLHGRYVPRTRALRPAELDSLLGACGDSLGALVRVCVALGCRRSEALGLTQADVAGSLAKIRGTKTPGSAREVPVLSVFQALLEQALPHLPVKAVSTNVNRELYWACRRAKVEHCSFNDFRRTHASWLLVRNVDRDHVRRLLGHKTTKLVDQVYGQLFPDQLAELIEPKLLQERNPNEADRGTAEKPGADGSAVPAEGRPGVCDPPRGDGAGEVRLREERQEEVSSAPDRHARAASAAPNRAGFSETGEDDPSDALAASRPRGVVPSGGGDAGGPGGTRLDPLGGDPYRARTLHREPDRLGAESRTGEILGRPQRESNPRYRRERPFHGSLWLERTERRLGLCRRNPLARGERRWVRLGIASNNATGFWAGRKGRAA